MGKKREASSLCLSSSQAQKLAALPNCSVKQAAEVAVTLTGTTGVDEKKHQKKYVENAASHASSKYRAQLVEQLEIDGQTVFITRLKQLLQRYCNQSPEFSNALLGALATTHTATNLILYVDETVSGNPLNPCNSKKSHICIHSGVWAASITSGILDGCWCCHHCQSGSCHGRSF